jgi:outer membrane receptor protein involved in Fe transport
MKQAKTLQWVLVSMVASPAGTSVLAAESRVIEEVIVTAQRVEEPESKVPIAMSAFDDEMIRDRQIIGLTDLHINIPNVTMAPRQGSFPGVPNIRGIGLEPVGTGVEVPSSLHINEIPTPNLYTGFEFYDLERVEVLRGPQGTLYGRNATAGAVNVVTKKPDFDSVSGYLDVEYGNHDHRRFWGALNVPVSDVLAFRVAATGLKRDGYIDNAAGGQIPGINEDLDGRDHYAARITAAWKINDRSELWLMYHRFDENSDRSWEAPDVCKQNAVPALSCEPNEFGRDLPHPGATGFAFALAAEGIIPLGARDAATGIDYEFPRPALDEREVFWDGNPETELEEEFWAFGFEWAFDRWHLTATGGYHDTSWRSLGSNTSRGFPVGITLGSTANNPAGIWPTSAFPRSLGDLSSGGDCPVDDYQAGVVGGCVADVPQTRSLAFATTLAGFEYWSLESKLRSEFDGPLNLLLGVNYSYQEQRSDLVVLSNLIDMFTTGNVAGPRLYPGFGGAETAGSEFESYAGFGEVYWQLSDSVKVTVGARYNVDEKRSNEGMPFPFQSIDANFFLGGALGPDPVWVRSPLLGYLGNAPDADAIALADYYGAADAISAATDLPTLISALQIVPPTEQPGELRALAGRPAQLKFKEWSGRIVMDWLFSPTAMVYAKYNRGFKPGAHGFQSAPDLDSEIIDSIEIGTKARLFDNTLSVNAAAFMYWYDDMHIGPGTGFEPKGRNADVDGHGVELDFTWRPARLPNLVINLAYGWVNVELDDYQEIDERDPTQGNPAFIALNSFGAELYVAPIAEVLPLVDQAIAAGAAISDAQAPGTTYSNGIPAYFNRAYLDDQCNACTLDGIIADLKGNQPRHAPEHSVSAGAAYSWFLAPLRQHFQQSIRQDPELEPAQRLAYFRERGQPLGDAALGAQYRERGQCGRTSQSPANRLRGASYLRYLAEMEFRGRRPVGKRLSDCMALRLLNVSRSRPPIHWLDWRVSASLPSAACS